MKKKFKNKDNIKLKYNIKINQNNYLQHKNTPKAVANNATTEGIIIPIISPVDNPILELLSLHI